MAPPSGRDVTVGMTETWTPRRLASFIDHTLLRPEATPDDLRRLCDEAVQHGFYSVCVNGSNVGFVARSLESTEVKVTAVVGFPLGATLPRVKAFETRELIQKGAQEIDVVMNIGALLAGDYRMVLEDLHAVVHAASEWPVKVIIEANKLTPDQKQVACALAKAAGAAFVKTSTGFGDGGATAEDVALLRRVVGPDVGVKASGGIRDRPTAMRMIEAGASRLGTSASVAIVTGD